MAPDAVAAMPLVLLAMLATIIASQAVITGAYSLTQQAIQLGLLPRLRIRADLGVAFAARSTCRRSTGCCWSGVLVLVVQFRTSSAWRRPMASR